jgi:hypothetical protein
MYKYDTETWNVKWTKKWSWGLGESSCWGETAAVSFCASRWPPSATVSFLPHVAAVILLPSFVYSALRWDVIYCGCGYLGCSWWTFISQGLGNWAEQSLYFKALTGFTLQHYFTYSNRILMWFIKRQLNLHCTITPIYKLPMLKRLHNCQLTPLAHLT